MGRYYSLANRWTLFGILLLLSGCRITQTELPTTTIGIPGLAQEAIMENTTIGTIGCTMDLGTSSGNINQGRIAFVSDRDGNAEIYVMNADGSEQRRLTYDESNDFEPSWSPDGKYVVFTSERDGLQALYIMNADGSEQKRLTNTTFIESNPRWSPDESHIAFEAYNTNTNIRQIIMFDRKTGEIEVLVGGEHMPTEPSWSFDGETILFVSNIDHDNVYQNELYTVSLITNSIKRLSNPKEYNIFVRPMWSPDNQHIVFSTLRDPRVIIMDVNSLEKSYLTTYLADAQLPSNIIDQLTPYWSPEGNKIVFAANDNGSYLTDLYVLDLKNGQLQQLTKTEANDLSPSWWFPKECLDIGER